MSTSSSSLSSPTTPIFRQSKESCPNIVHLAVKDPLINEGLGGGCPESIMRLFKRKKNKDKSSRNHQRQEEGNDNKKNSIHDNNQKTKKKSLLKRIFKSNKKKIKGDKKGNQGVKQDHTETTRDKPGILIPSETSTRSVMGEQEVQQQQQQQLIIENEVFKDKNEEGNASTEVELNASYHSSLHAPLSDFLMEQESPEATATSTSEFLKLASSPVPIYRDDDDEDSDDDYDPHDRQKGSKKSSSQQHTETLDVTQELSFSSSLSLWTKSSAVKVNKKADDASSDDFYNDDDLNTTGDSPGALYKRDSEQEESEDERTFNGLFEEQVSALEDTLEQIKSLSDQEDSSSSRTGSLSQNEEEMPVAPPESPPHVSLILPNLSPIKSSKVGSPTNAAVSGYESSSSWSAPQSPSPTTNCLDNIVGTSTPTAVSPIASPLQLKQRTRQDRFALAENSTSSTTGVNSITRSYHSNDEEASMSTNNSVYLDCVGDNADADTNAGSSIFTADGEVCKDLLVQFDEYSNQYSLGLQVRKLMQERDELLANQQKERELHQGNYKAFCEKIQRLEEICSKQREQRQSFVEQLAHQSVLHRQSVLQLSFLRKQQQEFKQQQQQQQRQQQDENPWTQLTATAPVPAADDMLEHVQSAVQKEGAAILDRFLLDDQHREQLEEQLEDSLNERHQLIAKFGQELGSQLARYRQLEDRFKAEQNKYNRQVGLNAQLEQQVFHLQQDYEELEEKYTHLQDWQAAIIRKHERQQNKRASPARRKDEWTTVLGEAGNNDDDESDMSIMEA
ncbi:unnamed protein product [Cylindrotheca closterium]|uniref:Uncharacterized protein n=1 Tax=Cylindrotheca closterium TaxID=2856 RepID=A0AAD2CPC6_9STRA|nr:unnamed protein product [Cylindrotheca closterium]